MSLCEHSNGRYGCAAPTRGVCKNLHGRIDTEGWFEMKLKRLFKVIVLGGAALGAVKCGNSTTPSNNDAGNTCQTDGGTDGGCGTQFW